MAHISYRKKREAFVLRPDLYLEDGGGTTFILDAKWKRINPSNDNPKNGIDQGDVYQLCAYAKAYKCDVVALVYPRTRDFHTTLEYCIIEDIRLICLPFNVENPENSVTTALRKLRELNS